MPARIQKICSLNVERINQLLH